VDGGVDGSVDAMVDATADADAEPPVPPSVRFIGRFDTTPAAGPRTSFAAAQIVARFNGTEVKATFNDAKAYNEYGGSRWEAIVDGVSTTFQLTRAVTTYTLATGLAPGDHLVELWKLSEASVGVSQFLGFEFPGGALLAPPPARTRRMEFLGDSASNGYGVDGAPGCSFSGATQNAHKAYPALIAADLDADHHNLSTSGKGLYYNYSHSDTEVFSIIYPRTLAYSNTNLWSFASYTPDVVWMTLGGNDFAVPAQLPPAGQFQARYDAMVTTLRTKYPDAHIFCAVAASLSDSYPAGSNAYTNVKTTAQAVVAAKNGDGDAKIYFFDFARVIAGETNACDGHINASKHRKMADEAVTFIKTKTGW